MRRPGLAYLAQHLVEPRTLNELFVDRVVLKTARGSVIPVVDGVPVFSGLEPSPQWRDEMEQTKRFAQQYVRSEKPDLSRWAEPWIRNELVGDDTRVVCVGGSFSDDVPHITKGHKFNVDLCAHIYTQLPAAVMEAQDTVFVSCWAEALPFANGSVQFVYMRNALDHFANPINAVVEAHRILGSGGQFCLAVYYDSSWFDAHETNVVDEQFLHAVITPLFETEHLGFAQGHPTGPVLKSTRTRFMYYVGRKRDAARLKIDIDVSQRYELIGTAFQKALYEREHHNGTAAAELYRTVISVPPVCRTDSYRQLHACLDLLAMSDKDASVAAAWQMQHAGIARDWSPIANLTLGRHFLDIEDLPASPTKDPGHIACPGSFDSWKWLVILAACTESGGNMAVAGRLRSEAYRLSPLAREWDNATQLV